MYHSNKYLFVHLEACMGCNTEETQLGNREDTLQKSNNFLKKKSDNFLGFLKTHLYSKKARLGVVVKKTTVHCWNLQHKLIKEALDQMSTSPDGSLSSGPHAVDVTSRETRGRLAMPMATYRT